jgi:hypothetical protein
MPIQAPHKALVMHLCCLRYWDHGVRHQPIMALRQLLMRQRELLNPIQIWVGRKV